MRSEESPPATSNCHCGCQAVKGERVAQLTPLFPFSPSSSGFSKTLSYFHRMLPLFNSKSVSALPQTIEKLLCFESTPLSPSSWANTSVSRSPSDQSFTSWLLLSMGNTINGLFSFVRTTNSHVSVGQCKIATLHFRNISKSHLSDLDDSHNGRTRAAPIPLAHATHLQMWTQKAGTGDGRPDIRAHS